MTDTERANAISGYDLSLGIATKLSQEKSTLEKNQGSFNPNKPATRDQEAFLNQFSSVQVQIPKPLISQRNYVSNNVHSGQNQIDYQDPLDQFTKEIDLSVTKNSYKNPRASANYHNLQSPLVQQSTRTRDTIGMAGNSIIHANPHDYESINHYNQDFEQMQNLRQQNQKLKSKMTQLTLALDKAVGSSTRNSNIISSSPERRINQIRKPPFSGNQDNSMNMGTHLNVKKIQPNKLEAIISEQNNFELQKQMDINRRLNELLNQKDDEILQLNNQILELKMNTNEAQRPKSNLSDNNKSPKPLKSITQNKYAEVYNKNNKQELLEEKLRESERLNKEYQNEIKTMQRIQVQQSKALESLTNETDFPSKINVLENDLRVQKEQNKQLRQKLYDQEKNNQRLHQNMVGLEETVRELRAVANGKVQREIKDKQQEFLLQAEEKIDELVKANSFLSKAKDKQVQLTTKTKQQYARQMARLHRRINELTELCERSGLNVEEAPLTEQQ